MQRSFRRLARVGLDTFLARFDWELSRTSDDPRNYVPLHKTMRAARKARMPLGDYIDSIHGVPGVTQRTIEKLKELNILQPGINHIVEIGPGSGRYLDRTLAACHPTVYEIYETATPWRKWLAKTYPVIAHIPDGHTLSQTPTGTADLVQAHKVFCVLPITSALHYVEEMARVARQNGWVVFDFLSEECLTPEQRDEWYHSGVNFGVSMIPERFVLEMCRQKGLVPVADFLIDLLPGKTHYHIFRKNFTTSTH